MTRNRRRVLGGVFGLEFGSSAEAGPAPFREGQGVERINARSCIAHLCDRLVPERVWLPTYLCESVVDAIPSRFETRFWEVDEKLRPVESGWMDEVRRRDLFVAIAYFGWPPDGELLSRMKERGAWVLEDASQALLSRRSDAADFTVYSPRKFLGVPDGGILLSTGSIELDADELERASSESWLRSLEALVLRAEFDRHGGDRRWFDLYRESEASQPLGEFAMSELSKSLLDEAFDYAAIAARRRENYARLHAALSEISLMGTLEEDVVPLGFPVRWAERDHLREALFAEEIFPPVHWQLPASVSAEAAGSWRLSRETLTLPCDQRCSAGDIDRIIACVQRSCR